MTSEAPRTLQEVLERAPSVQELLYHNPTGARVYPVVPLSSPTGGTNRTPGGIPSASSTSPTT